MLTFCNYECLFQAKILYKAIPFLEDERENIKFTIQSNVYGYLGILLEGRERFEEECLDEMRKQCSSSQMDANGMIVYTFITFSMSLTLCVCASAYP